MKRFWTGVVLCVAGFLLVNLAQTAPSVVPAVAVEALAPAAAAAGSQPGVEEQLAELQKRMQDWAQLGYYRDRDSALPPPAAGQQRVVFLGDSITAIWGDPGNKFFPGKPYVNRGINGQTTAQMVLRFHQDVVDLHPKAVVIVGGTNDIAGNAGAMTPEETLDDFRAMVEMARENGIKVVIGSVPPAKAFFWNKSIEPAPKIKSLNEGLEAWCRRRGIVWVDYYSALADEKGGMKPGLSLDGVHPTPAGFAVMAPLAEAGIEKALGK